MLPLSYLPHCPNKPGRETERMRMLFLNSHCYSVNFYASTNSLDYCRFLVSFEVRKCRSQTIICKKKKKFFWGCSGFLVFPYRFWEQLVNFRNEKEKLEFWKGLHETVGQHGECFNLNNITSSNSWA